MLANISATWAASDDGTSAGRRSNWFDMSFMISDSFWGWAVMVPFSQPLMCSGRYDFDAVLVPDHYHLGTDDLSLVVWEHFQLPLNQGFHVLEDIGKIIRRSRRIESQVSFLVLLKLPPPNFGRSAGHIPCRTGGVQTILPLANRIPHPEETCRHFRDHLGHLAFG